MAMASGLWVLPQQRLHRFGIGLLRQEDHQVARRVGDGFLQRIALEHPPNLDRRSHDAGNVDFELVAEHALHGASDPVGMILRK